MKKEIEELEKKIKTMDKAYFNSIKKCETEKGKLKIYSGFEFIIIVILLMVILL